MDNSEKRISQLLKEYSGNKITLWSKNLDTAKTTAELATLRKYIGKDPDQVIEPWAIILDGNEEILKYILDPKYGQKMMIGPNKAEIALYYSFALYALHQRSKKESMHTSEQKFGQALHQLVEYRASKNGGLFSDESKKIFQRLKCIAGKRELKLQMAEIRGLISLLNEAGIPFDYSKMTVDLFWMQYPNVKNRILIEWINDFNRATMKKTEEEK